MAVARFNQRKMSGFGIQVSLAWQRTPFTVVFLNRASGALDAASAMNQPET